MQRFLSETQKQVLFRSGGSKACLLVKIHGHIFLDSDPTPFSSHAEDL